MTPDEPFATGRDADVYAVGADRVLRRYRDGADVAREAAVMVHLAAHGFPVPTVFHAAGPDLVMSRVPGPTMLAALLDGTTDVDTAAAVLAGLHHRLHGVPARRSSDPDHRVLHLDLHPDNVLLGPDGPVLIDWRNAGDGPPELDVAMSAVILAQAAVGAMGSLTELARPLLPAFLAAVGGRPARQLDAALALRGRDGNLTADEVANLARAGDLVRAGG